MAIFTIIVTCSFNTITVDVASDYLIYHLEFEPILRMTMTVVLASITMVTVISLDRSSVHGEALSTVMVTVFLIGLLGGGFLLTAVFINFLIWLKAYIVSFYQLLRN